MASGGYEGQLIDIQLNSCRHSITAPRYGGSHGNRTGDERSNGFLFLQAGETVERRSGDGPTAHCGRGEDSYSDRRRELCRTGEGLSARAVISIDY